MNRWHVAAITAAMITMGSSCYGAGGGSSGQAQVAGVVSVTPGGPLNCMAARVALLPEQSLVGIRWYNNDQATVFPRVAVVPATESGEPAGLDSGITIAEVAAAASLAWHELLFPQPVTTEAGALFVVFVLPAFAEREGEGDGGGPGLGFCAGEVGSEALISRGGTSWVRIGCPLAVLPIYGSAGGGAQVLSRARSTPSAAHADDGSIVPLVSLAATPNPFNPTTELQFSVQAPGRVQLAIYDVRGALIAPLVDEQRESGSYAVRWDGLDARGRPSPSGLYIARLQAGGLLISRRLSLVR